METGSQTKPHSGEINASWGGLKAALPTTIGIKVYKNISLSGFLSKNVPGWKPG